MKTIKKIIKNLQKENMVDTKVYKEGYYKSPKNGEIIICLNREVSCTEIMARRIADNFGKKGYKARAYGYSGVAIKPQKLLDNIDECFNI